MMRQPSLRGLTAYAVCLVFLTTIASPLIAARSTQTAELPLIRVAVGPCVDNSRSAYGDLSTHLTSAAQLAVADSDRYRLVPLESSPGPERVLRVALNHIDTSGARHPMQVTLAAELRSAASGERICSASAVTTSSAVPVRTGSSEMVARAAITTGVQAVVAQVTRAAEITGTVIDTSRPDHVRVNLGRTSGIKPGAELAIYREGKYVATVEIKNVGHRECTGILTDIQAGTIIRAGDEVRVVSIPAKAPKKQRGKGKRSAVITGLVVLAGVGLLVGLNSWGSHNIPVTDVVDPLNVDKTNIDGDGSDSVLITALVNDAGGSPVRNDIPIIFRITAGRGSLNGSGTQVQARTADGAATVTLTTEDETSPPIVVSAIPRSGTSGSTPPITVNAPPP